MKILKRMAAAAAMLTLFLSLSAMTAMAADTTEGYDYRITLHAGNMGELNGTKGGSETVSVQYGDTVVFDLSNVKVTDDRYYIRGVKRSGRDNNEVAAAFTATEDADYVVAYGIKGNMVAYTVKYQDASGRQLAPDSTFYGNVGDKPIVAYKYIANYVPRALALTKTLTENEADNVFIFVYNSGNPGTITIPGGDTTNVVTVVVPGVTTVTGNGNGGAGAAGGAGGQNAGDNAGDAEDGNGDVTTPDNLVDLDEDQAPAANIDLNGTTSRAFPLAAACGIAAGAIAALFMLIVWIRRRMQTDDEE